MNHSSNLDPAMLQAYRETEYRVEGEHPFTLRIGKANPHLRSLYRLAEVKTGAFITACNPHSRLSNGTNNLQYQQTLADLLSDCQLRSIPGVGQHPSNDWPAEPSFLVLGLSLDSAKSMATRFSQNAIIWCDRDAIPQLILLR